MKKKINKKGFTLIELLAVIVILGLLMAIAIPSVTKYITESRKKTLVSTIGNYMNAIVNEVNDFNYTFTGSNTIYAVPIECISIERGGINPLGEWMQASNGYWAYVLVQYDNSNSSYRYGYTFKDSAGYGLYPIIETKLNENGNQIQKGLDLEKPSNGNIMNVVSLEIWQKSGFDVDENTYLVVLDAETEGKIGDGMTTCTLQQRGENYNVVENNKEKRLIKLIMRNNLPIYSNPTLTTSSNNTTDASGLYVSTATNSGNPTYYFRGNVENNYVKFAARIWRIIRINEDGTIRLISSAGLPLGNYDFNSTASTYEDMYYSNSDIAMPSVNDWYKTNITAKGYDSYVAISMFCEQAKVKGDSKWNGGDAIMASYSAYIPDFKCSRDGNGKGILNSKVGLITYDEVVHAGGYPNQANDNYYLYLGRRNIWGMSPAGFISAAYGWNFRHDATVRALPTDNGSQLIPVINLKYDVLATGTGTSDDPYVIKNSL